MILISLLRTLLLAEISLGIFMLEAKKISLGFGIEPILLTSYFVINFNLNGEIHVSFMLENKKKTLE